MLRPNIDVWGHVGLVSPRLKAVTARMILGARLPAEYRKLSVLELWFHEWEQPRLAPARKNVHG
jgi:hypothetical protein